ncbi:spore coat protein [Metabacillus sp. 113a]|uniref:spore coat protein n=1 Tax=Metabacillus sp. 113a TaxID=3404706 RepID=UPI003CE7BB2B
MYHGINIQDVRRPYGFGLGRQFGFGFGGPFGFGLAPFGFGFPLGLAGGLAASALISPYYGFGYPYYPYFY